jgi:hypothetical protein
MMDRKYSGPDGDALLAAWRKENAETGIGYRPFHRKYYAGEMSYDAFWGRLYRAQQKYQDEEQIDETIYPRREIVRWPRVYMRGCVYDIEATSLDATGLFVAGCILPLDSEEIITYRLRWDERGADKRLLLEFLAALCEFDLLIGHNVHGYDINWLHSRMMYYHRPWPRAWLSFDTYQVAKTIAVKVPKNLASLAAFLGVYDSAEAAKTRIWGTALEDLKRPDPHIYKAAMDDIVQHCQNDVRINRDLYDALFPYSLTMGTNPFKVTKWRVGVPATFTVELLNSTSPPALSDGASA